LAEKGRPLAEVFAKVATLKGPRGPRPKNYKPQVTTKRLTDDEFELTMDMRSGQLLRQALQLSLGRHKALRFHFYSILVVYLWGTYETYLSMLFEELYRKRPELLISNETLTYRDAVEKRDDLISLLVEKQLERIGRFTLTESLKYLQDRINFQLKHTAQKDLADFYLVRNIIAHSTGILRPAQTKSLPRDTSADKGELRVTKTFLVRMLERLDRVVRAIEKHVGSKFYPHPVSGSRPA
jgi:hypothetical protein